MLQPESPDRTRSTTRMDGTGNRQSRVAHPGLIKITAASAVAMATGLVNVLSGRGERHPVVLKVGDHAPEFALAGSDGRIHRLAELVGRSAVVIAWFPRAFTG